MRPRVLADVMSPEPLDFDFEEINDEELQEVLRAVEQQPPTAPPTEPSPEPEPTSPPSPPLPNLDDRLADLMRDTAESSTSSIEPGATGSVVEISGKNYS